MEIYCDSTFHLLTNLVYIFILMQKARECTNGVWDHCLIRHRGQSLLSYFITGEEKKRDLR